MLAEGAEQVFAFGPWLISEGKINEKEAVEGCGYYEQNEPLWEEYMMEDADICIVAFGIAARVSKNAIAEARKKGIKVGLIRPITLWPFPKAPLAAAADKVKAFLSVELSMGQMIEDVELATRCKKPVYLCNRVGGMIMSPAEVLAKIEAIAKGEEA